MTNPDTIEQQTIALAGLFQALSLARQCAWQGRVETPEDLETSLNSLLVFDARDAESVYGNRTLLASGLKALLEQLGRMPSRITAEPARYAATLLYLERRLHSNRAAMDRLTRDIINIRDRQHLNSITDPPLLEEFARIYSECVSPLGPKLMVNGEPAHLRDPENAARIRALLLAGLRSTMLWRHWGGNRLRMIVFRGRYRYRTRRILESIAILNRDRT